jgi:hypothetical protein
MYWKLSTVALVVMSCFGASAQGAITWQWWSTPHQSGTPAPVGFDIRGAVFSGDTAIILDEPASGQNWVGYETWTTNGIYQVDYSFKIEGHDVYFSPSITQVSQIGFAAMTQYYLWEPLPADLDPRSVTIHGWGSWGFVDFSGIEGGDGQSLVPEPSSLAIFGVSSVILMLRRRRRYGNS